MATTNHYDLIVIGSDIAGLVAASLTARRGKRVLVIPHGPADGTYRLARETFSLNEAPLIHLGCPALHRVYDELGLWTQISRERRTLSDIVHWILPEQRMDLQPGMLNWSQEAERAWPDDPVREAWELRHRWAHACDELLDEVLASEGVLTADGFWGRRFLNRVAEQLPATTLDELEPLRSDHPLRAGARALEPWYLHLSPSQLGKAASLRISELWSRGPEDRTGGESALRQQLLQRIQLKSGDVKPNLRVGEILLKRGKVTGIALLGKKDRYGCDQMLIASDPQGLVSGQLLPEPIPKALALSLSGLKRVAHRFVMHLEIAPEGLSPALGGISICVPLADARGPHGEGLTYLRRGEPTPHGHQRISVTRIVGAHDSIASAREQLLQELDERGILPFVHDHLAFVHSPHDGREASDGRGSLVDRYGTATALRLPMTALYETEIPPTLGVGVLPHFSGIKNLYLASQLTYPGLGLEGEFAAGWAAAGVIASTSRPGLGRNLFLGRGR